MFYVQDYKLTDGVGFSFRLDGITEATDQDGNPKKRNNFQVYKIKGTMTASMPDVEVSEMVNKQFVDGTGILTGDKFQMSSSTAIITKALLKAKNKSEVTITKTGKYDYTVDVEETGLGDLVESVQSTPDDEPPLEEEYSPRSVATVQTERSDKDAQTQRSITMSYVATIASTRPEMGVFEMVGMANGLNEWIATGGADENY